MKVEPASPDQRVPSQSNTATRGFRAWTRVWNSAVVRRVDKWCSERMSIRPVDKTNAKGAKDTKKRRGAVLSDRNGEVLLGFRGSIFRKQEKV
jgi:hypothetical protein